MSLDSLAEDDRPTFPDPYALQECPTVPRPFSPMRLDTCSEAFFAAGLAVERSHQRRPHLVRFVALVSLVCTAITIVAVALEWARVHPG